MLWEMLGSCPHLRRRGGGTRRRLSVVTGRTNLGAVVVRPIRSVICSCTIIDAKLLLSRQQSRSPERLDLGGVAVRLVCSTISVVAAELTLSIGSKKLDLGGGGGGVRLVCSAISVVVAELMLSRRRGISPERLDLGTVVIRPMCFVLRSCAVVEAKVMLSSRQGISPKRLSWGGIAVRPIRSGSEVCCRIVVKTEPVLS